MGARRLSKAVSWALAWLLVAGCAHRPRTTAPLLPPPATVEPATPRLGLVMPSPSVPPAPEQVTVRRVVTHHLPGPTLPPPIPTPSGVTALWLSPWPPPRPTSVEPPPARDPLLDALAEALVHRGGDLPDGTRLVLPPAGPFDFGPARRLVVAPAEPGAATDVPGWQWTPLAASSPALRAYQRELGGPLGWTGQRDARRAVWLSAGVRAGWWAQRAEAVELLRQAVGWVNGQPSLTPARR